MAFVGMRKPIVGKMTNETTYEKPEACGRAIGITVTPSYAEGSLYGDDMQIEYDKEFRYADVSLNTSELPIAMHKAMFGRTEAAEEVVYKVGDEAGYVGLAWISVEKVNGARKFVSNFLPKVKFSEPAGEYATKGENFEYKTTTLTGRAIANSEGVWKKTKAHETEEEALTTINTTYFKQVSRKG